MNITTRGCIPGQTVPGVFFPSWSGNIHFQYTPLTHLRHPYFQHTPFTHLRHTYFQYAPLMHLSPPLDAFKAHLFSIRPFDAFKAKTPRASFTYNLLARIFREVGCSRIASFLAGPRYIPGYHKWIYICGWHNGCSLQVQRTSGIHPRVSRICALCRV